MRACSSSPRSPTSTSSRSKGLLHGLAGGTNWVFRDECCHLDFAFEVVNVVRAQEPDLWDDAPRAEIVTMLPRGRRCETAVCRRSARGGVAGLSAARHARSISASLRLTRFNASASRPVFHAKNPFAFMDLQDVQELTNFFERRVSAYQIAVEGEVGFGEDF